jgi:hypothetical protein
MNAHSLTLTGAEDARHVALGYEAEPTVESIQTDLEETKLGSRLLDLLMLAQDIDDAAAKREASHVMNGRRHLFSVTPAERLAEKLLNLLGSPEDVVVVRQLAERLAQ